jgi:hypothetical protein
MRRAFPARKDAPSCTAYGDDANPGTKAKPFKSIAKALGAGKPRIVACEGEYVGSLDVTTGVSLYGGVSCDFAKAGGRAKVSASKPDYGIKIAKVADAVVLCIPFTILREVELRLPLPPTS